MAKMRKTDLRIEDTIDFQRFNELGIKYTVDSIVFAADHNRTMNDLIDFYGRADNIIYLVGAGLKDKTIESAKSAIMSLMDSGLCLEVIYCLCVVRARECGFFINERGLETLDAMSQSKNLMDNKTVMDVIVRVMAQYQKSVDVQNQMT